MPFEILVGLEVRDEELYRKYRAAMTPILRGYGGSFRYDFRVGEVLRNESEQPINRVFTISFPDKRAKEKFFADPEYLKVRETFFVGSVGAVNTLAEYARP